MITIVTYNIHYGVGYDGRLDLSRILTVIEDADIVALQEVDRNWNRTDNVDQVAFFRSNMTDHFVAWGPNVDLRKPPGGNDAPESERRRQFGNMILSRFPISSIRNHLLPRYGASDLLDMQRGALEAVIDLPGGSLRVYCTHLCHLSEAQRVVQATRLLDIHKECRREGPVLSGHHPSDPVWSAEASPADMPDDAMLLGDFNSQPDSEVHRMIVGETNPRYGPVTPRGRFVDAWRDVQQRAGASTDDTAVDGVTRYDSLGVRTGRRIDYCFLSERLGRRLADATVLADADGSDHQPLFVTLREADDE